MRAATPVEILSVPTATVRPFGLAPSRTLAEALGRLVKQAELGLSALGFDASATRNHTNHVAAWLPVDLVAGADAVQFGNRLGNSDLVFGCDLRHVL